MLRLGCSNANLSHLCFYEGYSKVRIQCNLTWTFLSFPAQPDKPTRHEGFKVKKGLNHPHLTQPNPIHYSPTIHSQKQHAIADRHCRLLKELLLFCNDYSVEENRKEGIKISNHSRLGKMRRALFYPFWTLSPLHYLMFYTLSSSWWFVLCCYTALQGAAKTCINGVVWPPSLFGGRNSLGVHAGSFELTHRTRQPRWPAPLDPKPHWGTNCWPSRDN